MSTYAYVSPFYILVLFIDTYRVCSHIMTILAIVYRILCRITYIGISHQEILRSRYVLSEIFVTGILSAEILTPLQQGCIQYILGCCVVACTGCVSVLVCTHIHGAVKYQHTRGNLPISYSAVKYWHTYRPCRVCNTGDYRVLVPLWRATGALQRCEILASHNSKRWIGEPSHDCMCDHDSSYRLCPMASV
jgi:hypothetical protein